MAFTVYFNNSRYETFKTYSLINQEIGNNDRTDNKISTSNFSPGITAYPAFNPIFHVQNVGILSKMILLRIVPCIVRRSFSEGVCREEACPSPNCKPISGRDTKV